MAGNRVERLNSQILKVLSSALLKLNDPNFDMLITFTGARTAPNVEFCKVGVSILEKDDAKRNDIFHKLIKASGFFKKEIASTLKLRVVPVLKFVLDDGAQHSNKIEEILKTLNIPAKEDVDE